MLDPVHNEVSSVVCLLTLSLRFRVCRGLRPRCDTLLCGKCCQLSRVGSVGVSRNVGEVSSPVWTGATRSYPTKKDQGDRRGPLVLKFDYFPRGSWVPVDGPKVFLLRFDYKRSNGWSTVTSEGLVLMFLLVIPRSPWPWSLTEERPRGETGRKGTESFVKSTVSSVVTQYKFDT